MKIPNLKEGDYAMKERFIENGIEYVRNGDYYISNLTVPDDKVYNIGKYGRMHAKFIKENRPCFYSMKMLNGTWLAYLEEIDTSAKEMIDRLIKELVIKRGVTEELKAGDQMAWVSAMEQIKHTAEEFVFSDLIYAMKLKAEQSKKRIAELDKLIERIYTDNVMGKISDERFAIMSANFEVEQKELRESLSNLEQSIIDAETEKVDMKRFLETIRECTDLKELTPAIINTLIKRIEVHNSVMVDGVKRVPVDIHFTAVGLINLPDEKELLELIEEVKANPLKSA